MNDVITFEMKWCKKEALCSVIDGNISVRRRLCALLLMGT